MPPAGALVTRWRSVLLAAGLLALPAAAQVPDWSLAARQRLGQGAPGLATEPPAPGDALAQRRQLLDDGERWLAAGQPQAAQEAFERAALMLHAADTEASLVRGWMQAGEYRRALAFGAHAAGAHRRDWPAGMALYAWLLQVGGQGVVARRLLDESLALAPGDAALLAALSQLAAPWPRATGPLLQPPLQIAPYAVGTEPPASAVVVGSALLVMDGQAALLPLALLPGAPPLLWLRNGLGQTVAAQLLARDDALGVALLRLAAPLPPAGLQAAPREPFAGSPGSLVEYATGQGGAAWPLLRQGFFARAAAGGGPRRLGISAPAGPRGGPVFNAAGLFVGLALAAADGQDVLVPAAALAQRFGALWPVAPDGAISGPPRAGRADLDQVYEGSLRAALQVLR